MARYNTFKYGDGTKYGTSPTNTNYLWTFMVDWFGDQSYLSGYNDARNMIDLYISRGRDHFIKPDGNGWERYKAGEAVAILDNNDGRYDPYNTSSPLYPYVTPGKHVIIKIKDGTDNYNVMYGIVSDIQPYSTGRDRKVKISVTDALGWLAGKVVPVIGLHQGENWDTNVDWSLDDIGYPDFVWPRSILDDGQYTMAYYWDSNKLVLQIMDELATAEMGQFWHNRFGALMFAAADTTHTSTLDVDEEDVLADITIPQPWEVVRNDIQVYSYPKELHAVNTEVWNLGERPIMALNTPLTVLANFRYDSQKVCGSGINIDASLAQNADGSGSTATVIKTILSEIGDSVLLQFTNTGFAGTWYLVGRTSTDEPARCVGDVIYTKYKRVVSATDTTSINLYGNRTMTIDSPWIQDNAYALAYAEHVLSQLKDPKKFPTIMVENRPSIQFSRDLYRDRIHFTSATLGIDDYFRIGKIEHRWLRANGQAVRTTWKLEPYLDVFTYP